MSGKPLTTPETAQEDHPASVRETPLSRLPIGGQGRVISVAGPRAFRRRLLELGLVPGTLVQLTNVAPLGDPIELEVRGCRLSIRKNEAAAVTLAVQSERRRLQVIP